MLLSRRLSNSSAVEKICCSWGLRIQRGSLVKIQRTSIGSISISTTRESTTRELFVSAAAAAAASSPSFSIQRKQYTIQQRRSFATGLVKEQSPSTSKNNTAVVDKDGNILGSAAKEAERLSNLATRNRLMKQPLYPENAKMTKAETLAGMSSFSATAAAAATTTTTTAATPSVLPPRMSSRSTMTTTTTTSDGKIGTEETLQNALEAAQALLVVTSKSTPLQNAIRNKEEAPPDVQRQISCLHRAFLAVTSWCLDVAVVSSDAQILAHALAVADRAYQLQLPLHLPLYQRMIKTVAQEYDSVATTSNANANATGNTNTKNQKRNYSRKQTAAGLILEYSHRVNVTLHSTAPSASEFYREALVHLAERRQFGEITALLRGMERQFYVEQLDYDTLAHLLAILQAQVEQDESLATGSGIHWQQTADLIEVLNLLNPFVWKTMNNYRELTKLASSQVPARKETSKDTTVRASDAVIPTTPKSPRRKRSARKQRDELYHYRRMIYAMDENFDDLPDLKQQIEKLNNGKSFRYSEEMERAILYRAMAEDAELFDDDTEADVELTANDLDQLVDTFSSMEDDFDDSEEYDSADSEDESDSDDDDDKQ